MTRKKSIPRGSRVASRKNKVSALSADPDLLQVLTTLFNEPTAPFREMFVLSRIKELLLQLNLPFAVDTWGNLVVGVSKLSELKSQKIRLALQAHTDHPGFHVRKQTPAHTISALWYGGGPLTEMVGAEVHIFDPLNSTYDSTHSPQPTAKGIITSVTKGPSTRDGIPIEIQSDGPLPKLSKFSFGTFAFPGIVTQGDQIYARSADDLAGCVIAILALYRARQKDPKCNAVALLTRAEEVGFVGCAKLIPSLALTMHTITLEASRALPMAEMGCGPVLRLGDRSNLYDSDLSVWLWQKAEALKKLDPNFMFQRRIMDGGSCEASYLKVMGFSASGLAVPLGNYHNQADADAKPAPEIINLSDVRHAVHFCTELLCEFKNYVPPSQAFKKGVQHVVKTLSPLLKETLRLNK